MTQITIRLSFVKDKIIQVVIPDTVYTYVRDSVLRSTEDI